MIPGSDQHRYKMRRNMKSVRNRKRPQCKRGPVRKVNHSVLASTAHCDMFTKYYWYFMNKCNWKMKKLESDGLELVVHMFDAGLWQAITMDSERDPKAAVEPTYKPIKISVDSKLYKALPLSGYLSDPNFVFFLPAEEYEWARHYTWFYHEYGPPFRWARFSDGEVPISILDEMYWRAYVSDRERNKIVLAPRCGKRRRDEAKRLKVTWPAFRTAANGDAAMSVRA